jgi:beta-lactamase superfamily II metal-dependent hydrolase
MNFPEATILDVGYGNCALIVDEQAVTIADTPQRAAELRVALEEKNIERITAVLVSHGDADHIGGLMALFTNPDVAIDRVYINPDAERTSEIWSDLRTALQDARRRGEVRVTPSLTSDTELPFHSDLSLRVLAPLPEDALGGVGGRSVQGRRQDANTLSSVIRVEGAGHAILLAADLDSNGLEALVAEGADLRAQVLVFPHHGGRPGSGDARTFARELTELVQPEVVVFSLGRGRPDNPRPEIVAGVRDAAPAAHIACTQLSRLCALALPLAAQPHLSALPAAGLPHNCCAGTLEIEFRPDGLYAPQVPGHRSFVTEQVPHALCLRGGGSITAAPASVASATGRAP